MLNDQLPAETVSSALSVSLMSSPEKQMPSVPLSRQCITVCTNKVRDKDLLEKVLDDMRQTMIDHQLQALSSMDDQDKNLARDEEDAAANGVWAIKMNPMQ